MTGRFVGDLDIHKLAGHNGRWWSLLEPLTFVQVDEQTGAEIFRWTAEPGSLTDFGSIPRPLWWLFPTYGKHTEATVIHDDLCSRKPIASRQVHDLFRGMLQVCGCAWLTVTTLWLAVRLFGPKFTAAS